MKRPDCLIEMMFETRAWGKEEGVYDVWKCPRCRYEIEDSVEDCYFRMRERKGETQ